MEVTLFFITSLSPSMTDLVLAADNAIVASPRQDVISHFKEHGITGYYIWHSVKKSVEEADKLFKELAMPGEFEDTAFYGTDLSLWEVLSIDRLKFWYDPYMDDHLNFIKSLSWSQAYVSLDIGSAFPLSIARYAYEEDLKCTAVRTEPIRTREIKDLIPIFNFTEYIVSSEEDEKFLLDAGVTETIIVDQQETGEKEVELLEKSLVRENMRVPSSALVHGVLFDKRDEWVIRNYMAGTEAFFFVYPVDKRSAELAQDVLSALVNKFTIITDIQTLGVCDEIVAFRNDENYPNIPGLTTFEYEL